MSTEIRGAPAPTYPVPGEAFMKSNERFLTLPTDTPCQLMPALLLNASAYP